MPYVIASGDFDENVVFWSEADGWTSLEGATVFPEEPTSLPTANHVWVQVMRMPSSFTLAVIGMEPQELVSPDDDDDDDIEIDDDDEGHSLAPVPATPAKTGKWTSPLDKLEEPESEPEVAPAKPKVSKGAPEDLAEMLMALKEAASRGRSSGGGAASLLDEIDDEDL